MGRLAALVPHILHVFRRCAEDEHSAASVLDFFEAYSETTNPPPSLTTDLVRFFLEIAADSNTFEHHIRIKALLFIEWIVVERSKILAKYRMLPLVLKTLLQIMSSEPLLDDDDDEAKEQSAYFVLHVLDCIASYVPAELVFGAFVRYPWTCLLSSLD